MKKIVIIAGLLLSSTQAMAHGNWLAPAAIGGLIGYEIGRPAPHMIYQQPQAVYQQPQVVYQQPQVVYQQPQAVYQQPQAVYQQRQIYVYPVNVPIPAGMRCELQSNNVNGQILTNNYCSY